MKKIINTLLIIGIIFTLTACGKKNFNEGASNENNTSYQDNNNVYNTKIKLKITH